MAPREIVIAFWDAMRTNNFHRASEWLSEDYECSWPQSKEIIRGRSHFAEINTRYPTKGKWQFDILELVEGGNRVVSDVLVTDGVTISRAITFHTIEDGLISTQKEFWADNYDAPKWREKWIELNDKVD